MRIICPHCERPGPCPDEFGGRIIKCPGCKKSFVAPRLNAEEFALAPENSGAPHLGIVSLIFGLITGLVLIFTADPVAILIPATVAVGLGQASHYRESPNPYAAVGRVIGLLGILAAGAAFYIVASRP